MLDFAHIGTHGDHPIGLENAVTRGQGQKIGLQNKSIDPGVYSRPANDELDFQSSARRLFNDKIVSALNDVLVDPQLPIRNLDPTEFTPKAVAERILSFIGDAVDQSAGEGDVAQQLLAQAKAGIEKGFTAAKEMLQSLGIFRGNIEADANNTYDLLQQGLSDFASRLADGQNLSPQYVPQQLQVAHSTESYSERQNSELQIQTQDGDIVTIKIQKSTDYSRSRGSYVDQNSGIYASEEHLSQSQGISFTVEGNLDQGELKAINELVGQVSQLSDKFFAGDSQAALHHALDIGYDGNEIANFSFSAQQSQTNSVTRTYAQVSEMESAPNYAPGEALNALLSPLSDVIAGMKDVLQQTGQLLNQRESDRDLKNLFNELSLMDNSKHTAINSLEDHSMLPIEQLTAQLFG